MNQYIYGQPQKTIILHIDYTPAMEVSVENKTQPTQKIWAETSNGFTKDEVKSIIKFFTSFIKEG
jgi:hypothetical protein